MTDKINCIINKLCSTRSLNIEEYEYLISSRNDNVYRILQKEALRLRHEIYGNKIFIRGLIEISNYCKNDCYYCGIRRSNKSCNRYRLSCDEILSCCENGYKLGFRTFVLQGGEDTYYNDELLSDLIKKIKASYPDCAVTLSLGERSEESYQRLYNAGADRYLLRHETADEEHYSRLHPESLSFESRMTCLKNLKRIGYQVGCGMMVSSPYQSSTCLAKDLKLIEELQPDMCGIGPFIPHKDTEFADEKHGEAELACFLLAITRIIKPNVLLPATTALNTIDPHGREKGISASANVVMPNLSPLSVRAKYELYNDKISTGNEAAEMLENLKSDMKRIGYEIVCDRGDIVKNKGD